MANRWCSPRKCFDVLHVLVQNAGHLVEKERLLSEVWANSFVEEGGLNRNVSILRKTLGEKASGEQYIQTVPKLGYRFVAPVTERFDDDLRSSPAGLENPTAADLPASGSMRAAGVAGLLLVVGALAYAVLRLTVPANTTLPSLPPTAVREHRQVTFHRQRRRSLALRRRQANRVCFVRASGTKSDGAGIGWGTSARDF